MLVKFKVEEHRLLNWAKTVQLDLRDDKLVLNHMSKGLIINILEQQQKLLFSFGRMNKKYERLTDPLLVEAAETFVMQTDIRLLTETEESSGSINGIDSGSKKTVKFPPTEALVEKSMLFMQQFKDVPKRLKWATFDHKKMEALISKLAEFNDKMHEALDKAQMELLIDMQTRTNDQIVLLNRTMSHMVQIYQSEQIAFRRWYTIAELEDSVYDGFGDLAITAQGAAPQPLAAVAQQRYIQLAIEDSPDHHDGFANDIGLPNLAKDIRETLISVSDIQTKGGHGFPEDPEEGHRTEATFKGNTPVWIEWKAAEVPGPIRQNDVVDPKIHERVKKLAALLSKNSRTVKLRAPFCRGYFIDTEEVRFGLVYEKPGFVEADTKPTTLHALIQDPEGEMPSLTDRIILMKLIAESVERFHAVDWLHKGLRSSNILLFADPELDGEIAWSKPLISGFDYSRPAMHEDMTERPSDNPKADIYRHPAVQHKGNREDASGRESYKKSFDLYSLGIVLLEIAYWRTINEILSIDLDDPKLKPRDTWAVKDMLLETRPDCLKSVRSHLGNTVEGVIRACLEGPTAFGLRENCDERSEIIAAELQKAFGERVVRRLACMKGL